MDIFSLITGKTKKSTPSPNNPKTPEQIASGPKVSPARSSEGPSDGMIAGWDFEKDETLVKPGFQFEVIPVIRKLSISNQSVSQALSNIVNLANTGIKITFDMAVPADQVDKMRVHLHEAAKNWHYGVPGMHGIINKMLSQAMISGAIVTEKVPKDDFTGIYRILFPKPESIRFVYSKSKISYFPYQLVKNPLFTDLNHSIFGGLKKLNLNTFSYVAMNGDLEAPYANPPYLPAIGPLEDQKVMLENIKFIIRQIGVVGFLQLMVAKPERKDLESEGSYKGRLESYLNECKERITSSMRDGIVVGYEDDHTFDFKTVTKNASGVTDLFNANELLVYSGLKQDASLSGKGTSGAESAITIIFTKLLSELKNAQICAATVLEDICTLELRLAGFKFNGLKVNFNASTIQDDYKMMQAQEIKIRNLHQLLCDGQIDMEQYADMMGFEKPAKKEPVVPLEPVKSTGDPNLDAQKKQVREKSKDTSDRRTRDTAKPQGTKK